MSNSTNGIQREIKVKGQKLGTVTSFKSLGVVVSLWEQLTTQTLYPIMW